VKSVIDVEQVVCVLSGVEEHFRRKRSLTPVGQLVLLVRRHVAEVVEQVGQTEPRVLEDSVVGWLMQRRGLGMKRENNGNRNNGCRPLLPHKNTHTSTTTHTHTTIKPPHSTTHTS